ncbi:MAG: DUF4920 domain-containing protein [Chlorobiaceae bacterium]|nr:DUF4920 domain-containing protein [Chlorobiaceae bacterium]MBA4310832.1 DUF4920 domain-containing protein [Chlorobiaceae bacterium]
MKKFFLFSFLVAFVFTSLLFASDKKFGKKLTLKETTKISDILENPESYLGKKVLVKGEIIDVCENAGCWMNISSGSADQFIKIKVKDGEIVFPVEAKGKTALAEGEVYKIELDHEAAIKYFQHFAEDAGKEFDPKTITGPVTIYQIKGFGAVIKNFK